MSLLIYCGIVKDKEKIAFVSNVELQQFEHIMTMCFLTDFLER